MIAKTARLTRAGLVPTAAALSLLCSFAARAEDAGPADKTTPAAAVEKKPAADTAKPSSTAASDKGPAEDTAAAAKKPEAETAKAGATSPASDKSTVKEPAAAKKKFGPPAKAAAVAEPKPAAAKAAGGTGTTDAAKKATGGDVKEPATTAALPNTSPGTASATVADQVLPPADPVVADIRQRLPDALKRVNEDDAAALVAFYGEHNGPAIWVSTSGFTDKGKAVVAEIGKADDWGLSASDFRVPVLTAGALSPEAAADAEIEIAEAVLKYARYARGGRVDPASISQLMDQTPSLRAPKTVLTEIAAADAPDAYLRSLNPQHEQFKRLRHMLLKLRGGGDKEEEEEPEDPALSVKVPPGGIIRPGAKNAQVALLRQRLKVPADDKAKEDIYDAQLQKAVRQFQRANNLRPDAIVGNNTRAVLNGRPKPAAPSTESKIERILINMERWRWLPENLGALHVWDNVPEFLTRVVKNGKVIHTDKIIVGQPTWPTPIFSADMKLIVFNPQWGVPNGIKTKELLPLLRKSSGAGFFGIFGGGYSSQAVLDSYDLRVTYNGRPVDANSVDWNSVDIRRYSFTQPPGPKNVLGTVKFRFPNGHDVYMHDTPERGLFARSFRALSHGCMRVENPRRLAEILLAEDKGWSPQRVRSMFGGYSTDVALNTYIPVHITYFTARVDDNGKLRTYGDFYGLDSRTAAALGRSARFFGSPPYVGDDEVGSDPDVPGPRRQARQQQYESPATLADAISNLFSP